MDNSVYQPLSHALHPQTSSTSYAHEAQHLVAKSNGNDHAAHTGGAPHQAQEEEEEEEEVDAAMNTSSASAQTMHAMLANSEPPRRRPGRPKGSKNKKKYEFADSVPKQQQFATAPFYGYTPPQQVTATPPAVTVAPVQTQTPQPVPQPQPQPQPTATTSFPAPDPNNQAFYDFQWRVLTLCSEFYNAADELIQGAPQHIIAQCFNLPPNQVDPISILHEARRACDQLMANPSQAVLKISTQSSPYVPPAVPAKDAATPSTGSTTSAAPVITNPGSFVVSLSSSTPAQPAYGGFQPVGTRYGTTPYSYYSTQPQQTGTHPYMAQQQVMKPVNLSTPAAAGNQGAWSDEEVEKLKELTEDSRIQGSATEGGEIDWDWVCNTWGTGRTRHQILIKATNLGLKESSTRGIKRRRDNESGGGEGSTNGVTGTTTQAVLNAIGAAADASAAASPERPASTSISPAAVHQQVPTTVPAPPGGGSIIHWGTNMSSPVISGGSSRSVYYNKNATKA